MKKNSLFFILLLIVCLAHAQVVNTKQGMWSDPTVWSNNSIPGNNDDVVLHFDIIIDVNAYCHSFNLNGYNATVNTGVQLYVTGINDNADTLLSRYVVIDTTVSPADTFQTIDFYYDNLKRNISYIDKEYSGGVISYQSSGNFFYIGDSRLPYMSLNSSGGANYYNYQNGRLVYDSSGNYVYHYTYLPNAIITQTVVNNTAQIITDTAYVEYDTNGNIIHQIDTTASFGEENFYYSFDNHPNPFNSTQLNCGRVLNSPETFIEESFAKNNMLEVNQYLELDAEHYQALYGYGYKANGYPKEIWQYDPSNPAVPAPGKILFIYTR